MVHDKRTLLELQTLCAASEYASKLLMHRREKACGVDIESICDIILVRTFGLIQQNDGVSDVEQNVLDKNRKAVVLLFQD